MPKVSWLPWKAIANVKDHHLRFDLAKEVFEDFDNYVEFQGVRNGEPRWFALGRIRSGKVLAVAYTRIDDGDEEEVQLISARYADKTERREYERQRSEKYRV